VILKSEFLGPLTGFFLVLRHSETGMLSIIFGVDMGGLDLYKVLRNAE
jgi:hypothetical protein